MKVSNDRLKQLRDRFAIGYDLLRFAPQEVFNTGRDLASLLNELIEFREAEEMAEAAPEQFLKDADKEMMYGGTPNPNPENAHWQDEFYNRMDNANVTKVDEQGILRIPVLGTVS